MAIPLKCFTFKSFAIYSVQVGCFYFLHACILHMSRTNAMCVRSFRFWRVFFAQQNMCTHSIFKGMLAMNFDIIRQHKFVCFVSCCLWAFFCYYHYNFMACVGMWVCTIWWTLDSFYGWAKWNNINLIIVHEAQVSGGKNYCWVAVFATVYHSLDGINSMNSHMECLDQLCVQSVLGSRSEPATSFRFLGKPRF